LEISEAIGLMSLRVRFVWWTETEFVEIFIFVFWYAMFLEFSFSLVLG